MSFHFTVWLVYATHWTGHDYENDGALYATGYVTRTCPDMGVP